MKRIFFIALLAIASGAYAEEIDIEKAVTIAFEKNHDLKIAQTNLEKAKEDVNLAWSPLLPALEAEASASRQDAESGFMALSKGQYDLKFLQMKFAINPGQFSHTLAMSQFGYLAAEADYKRVKSLVEFNTVKSYFDVILTSKVIELRKESVEHLKSNLKDVENLYSNGSVPKFELLQAQVELKNEEPLLFDAENSYSIALDRFNNLLGETKRRYTADASILEKNSLSSSQDGALVEKLISAGVKNRPEIAILDLRIKMAQEGADIADSSSTWPTFSLGGYYGMTKQIPGSSPVTMDLPPQYAAYAPDFSGLTGDSSWQNTWQVRGAATYRFSSLLPVDSSQVQKRKENLKEEEANEQRTKLSEEIAIIIRGNYSSFNTALLAMKSQKENVAKAEEGLRIAKESYRNGVIKNSDLLRSQLSLTAAKLGHINSLYNCYISLASLKRETGYENNINRFMEDIHE